MAANNRELTFKTTQDWEKNYFPLEKGADFGSIEKPWAKSLAKELAKTSINKTALHQNKDLLEDA